MKVTFQTLENLVNQLAALLAVPTTYSVAKAKKEPRYINLSDWKNKYTLVYVPLRRPTRIVCMEAVVTGSNYPLTPLKMYKALTKAIEQFQLAK